MGELFGLSSPRPVTLGLAFDLEPGSSGRFNREGWGVSFFQGPAAVTVKEASFAPSPPVNDFLAKAGFLRGETFVAYLRRWTTRSGLLANAHPFTREMGGREWVFAHNGNVEAVRAELPLGRFHPVGQTDSEHAFCYLLDRLAEVPEAERSGVIAAEAGRIARGGAFNFLLASGEDLWAYCSGEYGLSYLVRETPSAEVLADDDWAFTPAEPVAGVVVASSPLSGENWKSLRPGELLVVRRGEVRERIKNR